ncbi:hypothetical protein NH340_JMT02866 [Sarcoptes scabiei]|nr:hypothetical protein NH340_JMT02866 [Sarcoptes scabiei]
MKTMMKKVVSDDINTIKYFNYQIENEIRNQDSNSIDPNPNPNRVISHHHSNMVFYDQNKVLIKQECNTNCVIYDNYQKLSITDNFNAEDGTIQSFHNSINHSNLSYNHGFDHCNQSAPCSVSINSLDNFDDFQAQSAIASSSSTSSLSSITTTSTSTMATNSCQQNCCPLIENRSDWPFWKHPQTDWPYNSTECCAMNPNHHVSSGSNENSLFTEATATSNTELIQHSDINSYSSEKYPNSHSYFERMNTNQQQSQEFNGFGMIDTNSQGSMLDSSMFHSHQDHGRSIIRSNEMKDHFPSHQYDYDYLPQEFSNPFQQNYDHPSRFRDDSFVENRNNRCNHRDDFNHFRFLDEQHDFDQREEFVATEPMPSSDVSYYTMTSSSSIMDRSQEFDYFSMNNINNNINNNNYAGFLDDNYALCR